MYSVRRVLVPECVATRRLRLLQCGDAVARGFGRIVCQLDGVLAPNQIRNRVRPQVNGQRELAVLGRCVLVASLREADARRVADPLVEGVGVLLRCCVVSRVVTV